MARTRTYLALSFALASIVTASTALRADEPAKPEAPASEEVTYDWGVAYWMPYDNNLERCGKIILEGIRAGVAETGSRTVVAVQADFTDKNGMKRYTIRSNGVEEQKIDSEDSANEDHAIEYLEWFTTKFKCRRYVITFVNHGGRLDDMCQDENHGPSSKEWMSGKVLGEKMRKLKEKLGDRWELFFLQQCGRGSIENLYSFRGTAKYIMAAPIPVGAPNTYYTAFHEWLGEPEAKDVTGDKVAAKIMTEDEHYTIYTCLKTEKLDQLPKKLDAALEPFLAKKDLKNTALPPVIHPVGEPIVDLKTYLLGLANENGIETKGVDDLIKWTKDELFTEIRFSPPGKRYASRLCGLAIYAPTTTRERSRYERLDLYSSSKLMELWKKLPLVEKAPPKKKPSKSTF